MKVKTVGDALKKIFDCNSTLMGFEDLYNDTTHREADDYYFDESTVGMGTKAK